jgi:hypothetical protein
LKYSELASKVYNKITEQATDFNQFRIMGDGQNGSLGIKVENPTDKVFTLT